MRIRRIAITRFRMVLREPLETAAGRIETRDGVLFRLYGQGGLLGTGEATPIAGFGMEDADASWQALLALAPQLAGEDVRDVNTILDGVDAALPAAPCARSAIDIALHDAAGRVAQQGVASWLAAHDGRRARRSVAVNALLGARDPERLGAEAKRAVEAGYRTLKLKVAGAPLAADLDRVAAVRSAVGPRIRLRLDANGGWKAEEAGEAIARLAPFRIEHVEQPVGASELAALARLREGSSVRIVADESAAGWLRASHVIERRAADAICVKLGATGGIRASLRLARRAATAGMGVVVTSGLDGAIARAAALQLAAVLPGRLPACGLATGALLREDLAAAEPAVRGSLPVSRGAGLGVAPDAVRLSRISVGPGVEFEASGR